MHRLRPRALVSARALPVLLGPTEWSGASGKGTIYSFSMMRRAARVYAIAYVTLEEGRR